MQRDILHLYQRAQAGPLEAKEVLWLENQVNEFPYFALPRIILARHNFQKDQNVQNRRLQEGAAYSLDRGLFRNYLYMTLPEGSVAVEEPITHSGSTSGGTEVAETKETAGTKEVAETKEVASDTVAKADKPKDDPFAAGKINWFLNTRVQMRTNRYLGYYGKIKGGLFAPELVTNSNPQAGLPTMEASEAVSPEKLVSSAKDAVAPEAAAVEASGAAPEEELILDPKDTANPEPLVPKTKEKANSKLSSKEAEAKDPVFHLEPKTDTVPIEIDIQPAAAAESKESTPAKEASSEIANTSATASKAKATPKKAEAKKVVSKEEKARAVEALLASRRAKQAKSAGKPQTEEEKAAEYEIGSFSSFSFVDDVDPGDGGEGEANTLVGLRETVSLQTPDNPEGGYSELVIENDDRRLEILVTPEELEKYFKGKLPTMTSEKSGGDSDLMHLQFNFSVAEKEFDTKKSESTESVLEVQDLKAISSPEVISIVPTETELQDEERGQELIDKFIEHEPSITRGGHTKAKVGDLAKESVKDEDDWVTETLAKVYAMQGNNARAIRIYKKLTLIFPEKRAYFDVLIQKLKR